MRLHHFERYLTIYASLCMVIGVAIGLYGPHPPINDPTSIAINSNTATTTTQAGNPRLPDPSTPSAKSCASPWK